MLMKKKIFDVWRNFGGKKKDESDGLHPTQRRTVLLNRNNQNINILQNIRHAITKDSDNNKE